MNRKELLAIRLNLLKRDFPVENPPHLIAVTKRRPIEDIIFAYEAGVRDFGENRVEELEEKALSLLQKGYSDIRWHFIGNLQSNKVGRLLEVPCLFAIHSVDRFKLVKKIFDDVASLSAPVCHLFLQINTSQEEEKGGLKEWDELAQCLNFFLDHPSPRLPLQGLMTMSKLRTDHFERDALKCFERLKEIKDQVQRDFSLDHLELSMGMTNDYLQALQVGTDYLRIGSALFAPDQNSSL